MHHRDFHDTFTMDKSVEKAWDEYVQKFFASQELDFDME